MKNGDISNKACPTILLRVEDVLVKRKERKFGLIKFKPQYDLNKDAILFLNKVMYNTDYRVVLVMSVDSPNDYLKAILDNLEMLPFAYHRFYDYIDIKLFLESGVYICYVDNDSDRINKVGHHSCYNVAQISNMIL